jgi:hypothetical protein
VITNKTCAVIAIALVFDFAIALVFDFALWVPAHECQCRSRRLMSAEYGREKAGWRAM